jgi:protein SCO1
MPRAACVAALCCVWLGAVVVAQVPPPRGAEGVAFEQRLGREAPWDAPFVDDEGRAVTLRECAGGRPVVLALVYYGCPMLCGQVLRGVVRSLRAVPLEPGEDFAVVAVSIDPREKAPLAAAKKAALVREYGRGGGDGWRFLTGGEREIAALAEAVGFHFRYDAATNNFAHAAGIVVLTPGGRIARYFFGIDYAPRDVRLGLVEAADGKIGGLAERLLLLCFHYDPTTSRYGFAVMSALRAGGALTVLGLLAGIAFMTRRGAARPAGPPPLAGQETPVARAPILEKRT